MWDDATSIYIFLHLFDYWQWFTKFTKHLICMNYWNLGCTDSGQRCTAVKVILAMECIADQLVCKVNSKIQKLTVGSPDDDCDITPVISETSANFIEGLVQDAKCKGARFHQVTPLELQTSHRGHISCVDASPRLRSLEVWFQIWRVCVCCQ